MIPIHNRYISTNNLHHQGTDEQRVLALYHLFQHSCLTATICRSLHDVPVTECAGVKDAQGISSLCEDNSNTIQTETNSNQWERTCHIDITHIECKIQYIQAG